MQSNKLVQQGKPAVEGTSPDMTISVSESGAIGVTAGTTSANSHVCVTAESPYTGVCVRTGMTFDSSGAITNNGNCACGVFADGLSTAHLLVRAAAYTVKAGAGGSAGVGYKVVAINGGVISFIKTGEIIVGTGN